MARRTLQRAGRERLVAQSDPHSRRGGSPSGVVAGRRPHRLVQRRGGRVRPRHRRAGRREPAPHRHRGTVVLLPAPVVARRREARVHRHPLPGSRSGRRVGRHRPRRHRSLRAPGTVDEPGLVSRFALDRLRPPPRQPAARPLRSRHRVGLDAPAHRRNGGRHRSRVGRVREVPLLPRIHGLRPQHGLARHDVLRPSGHPRPVPRAAARRRALALPAAERRGRAARRRVR